MAMIPSPPGGHPVAWDQRATQAEEDAQAAYYDSSWGGAGRPRGHYGAMDIILPPAGLTLWDMPQSKLKTGAVAATFITTTAFIMLLAAGGLLAIVVTGAVVMACTMLLVLACAGLVALVVTGAPVGYGIWKAVESYQAARSSRE